MSDTQKPLTEVFHDWIAATVDPEGFPVPHGLYRDPKGDVMAGFHFTQGAAPRPFIIEYQYEPRIAKPIDWDNLFWTSALLSEMTQTLCSRLGLQPGQGLA